MTLLKKPININSQRVHSVVIGIKDSLNLLALVSRPSWKLYQEAGITFEDWDEALLQKVSDQFKYEEILEIHKSQSQDDEDYEANLSLLGKNTRELTRRLILLPGTTKALLKDHAENRPPINSLSRVIQELADLLALSSSTTVEEDKSTKDLLQYYIEREATASGHRDQLAESLQESRQSRTQDKEEKSQEIAHLKTELAQLQEETLQKRRMMRTQVAARMKAALETSEDQQEKARQKMDLLTEESARLRQVHREADHQSLTDLMNIRQETNTRKAEARQDWLNRQGQTGQVAQVRTDLVRKIESLQEKLEVFAKEVNLMDEEAKLAAETGALKAAAHAKDVKMAKTIVGFWKMILEREAFLKAQAKGTKGKTPGKKGKAPKKYFYSQFLATNSACLGGYPLKKRV